MKRATIIVIKVKSCNALLRMVLVRICSYLKSVLRYTFLILDTHQPDNTSMFTWARMLGSVVVLRSQKGPSSRTV